MVSLVVKPVIPNLDLIPDLNAVVTSHHNNLNQSVWNFLVIPPPPEEEEAICMIKLLPFPPPKKEDILA